MKNDLWFKNAVFYQIYPRSFCDSNNDGIGDIQGIISKLDYLKELGVNCVWLSPCYESPNDDMGYDISNYYNINSEYGTMEDWKEMIEEMHKRDIKFIMDLVVNHTSDEHPWFKESRKSKDNPYRDYYYWRKGKNGSYPNNWNSSFTGPAWEYDEKTDEYYLHLFTKKQVDLNWENPKVRDEVINILNFWFDLGVDGFRCDVINYISKTENLPNDPKFGFTKGACYYTNGPKIHQYFNFLNENAFSKREKLFLGECPGLTTEYAKLYTARERNELDIAFAFEPVESASLAKYIQLRFNLRKFKNVFSKWQKELENTGWNSLYLENHDQARSISRFGNDKQFRIESAKMLATMLATLKGSLFIFEGQELGLKNREFTKISDFKDTCSQSVYKLMKEKLHFPTKFIIKNYNKTARDQARLPMQWNSGKNAGFSDVEPWMPINSDYEVFNAESEKNDPNSVLNYYKKLISFRKEHSVIIEGNYTEHLEKSNNFYVYTRESNEEKLLIVLSFSTKNKKLPKISKDFNNSIYIFGNYDNKSLYEDYRPYECRIYTYE